MLAKCKADVAMLREHNENFDFNLKCWLINPAKTEIKLISKNDWK